MSINDFAKLIASIEGKKKQENIAQIKEQLSVTNRLFKNVGVNLYTLILSIREEQFHDK